MTLRRWTVEHAPPGAVDALRRVERRTIPVRWRLAVLVSWPLRFLGAGPVRRLLVRAVHAVWGNPSYSASPELCLAIDELAGSASRVIETGSGVTTLLLRRRPQVLTQILSLEHDAGWASEMERVLPAVPGAELRRAPLVEVEPGVDWYSIDVDELATYDLVVCDGPPADTTAGARRGVMTMIAVVDHELTVVVDDVHRPGEMDLVDEIVGRFDAELLEVSGDETKAFAVLAVPARPSLD